MWTSMVVRYSAYGVLTITAAADSFAAVLPSVCTHPEVRALKHEQNQMISIS